MEQNYYREYYHLEREHWWFVARGKMLMDCLRRQTAGRKDLKILNIGVATGRTSELLAEFGKVTSVEYDRDCFEFTRDALGLDIVNASILDLPFSDNSFDVVSAFDVIEHVQDDQLAAAEMLRVCRPGGMLYVTVPAYMFLWSRHDEVNHHFRRYTRGSLLELFENKTDRLYTTYFNFWLFLPIAFFRVLTSLLKWNRKQREDAGTDNFVGYNKLTNRIFYQIFYSERIFLGNRISLPFGVSFLAALRKR